MVLLTASAVGNPFGRFGYRALPEVPGFQIDESGFKAQNPSADRILFANPVRGARPLATSDWEQITGLQTGGLSPSKLRANLLMTGFELYFENGFAFRCGSLGSPYLTWREGSVRDGVPTPNVPWIGVSFATNQPPILLAFRGDPPAVSIRGSSGQWTLQSEGPYRGWVRVALPFGVEGRQTVTAAELGRLSRQIATEYGFLAGPPPRLVSRTIEGDATAVQATWTFDRPDVVVPSGAHLAALGGYAVRVLSPVRATNLWDDSGPLMATKERTLTLRFPARRIPTGRSIATGPRDAPPIATVSAIDIPSVTELALENLLASRDRQTRRTAETAVAEYLEQATYHEEPWTGQKLPFSEGGEGIDLAAAHALLMQALTSTTRATSEANALLTSLSWRRDWLTWRLWLKDDDRARRAAALAVLAGAVCPEPDRRLEAAMLQAGLAAQRGLGIWQARRGILPSEPTWLEVLEPLRRTLFLGDAREELADPFARSLLSDVRIFGDVPVTAGGRNGVLELVWQPEGGRAQTLTFATGGPVQPEGGNLAELRFRQALGFVEVRGLAPAEGPATLRLRFGPELRALPAAVPVPAYGEARR